MKRIHRTYTMSYMRFTEEKKIEMETTAFEGKTLSQFVV